MSQRRSLMPHFFLDNHAPFQCWSDQAAALSDDTVYLHRVVYLKNKICL